MRVERMRAVHRGEAIVGGNVVDILRRVARRIFRSREGVIRAELEAGAKTPRQRHLQAVVLRLVRVFRDVDVAEPGIWTKRVDVCRLAGGLRQGAAG